ncbi:MAG TPA: bifunctional riboflavin kinase/FAD synthetase [Candidatus Latescibacteria bacterium]|nr:bifunctional riboflavin kinase/FAD synthetase [Candidatus Latescibacterota bacterium]
MRTIENIEKIGDLGFYPVVSVGTFDGVHMGHSSVLKEVASRATAKGGTAVVLTFDPHPQQVIAPDTAPPLLTTKEEKLKLFALHGIHAAVVHPFTLEFSKSEPEEFVEKVLIDKIGVKELVVGYNHAFGKGRRGVPQDLELVGKRVGFEVIVVPPVFIAGQPVSSTRIRNLIAQGEIEKASELLGRNYSLTAFVGGGKGIGRRLGFPTANLKVNHSRKLIPRDGVYAVWVILPEGRRAGVMNIGKHPSFGEGPQSIEVHLLEFNGDLYGLQIDVRIVARLRDEIRFMKERDLARQIEADVKAAAEILNTKP